MKSELYIIQCKSNIHVGSGDTNYGVIDKLIQRDTTDDLPCIFSSSLKGAFREYFEKVIEKDKPEGQKVISDKIFGKGENKNSNGISKGSHIFQQAFLLSFPLRSNQKPFFNAISPFIIDQLLKLALLQNYIFPAPLLKELEEIAKLEPDVNKPILCGKPDGLIIEDFDNFENNPGSFPNLKMIVGDNIIILNIDDMKRVTDNYHLPIIARNKLENGQSQNLWYEQIVPRESKFTFFVATDKTDDQFKALVNNKTVQIGGDSSIGYGYSLIYSLI